MGQYYKPVSVDKKEHVYSHRYGNGLKLMEHSYIGNDFVDAVESLLVPGGRWHKDHIVWAGDYADCEKHHGEDVDCQDCPNLYDLSEPNEIQPDKKEIDHKKWRYLCNHDARQFVDYQKVIDSGGEWTIDPLPLLTADGNGRGVGDFRDGDYRVGTWARGSISIEDTAPEGYEEIDGVFHE